MGKFLLSNRLILFSNGRMLTVSDEPQHSAHEAECQLGMG